MLVVVVVGVAAVAVESDKDTRGGEAPPPLPPRQSSRLLLFPGGGVLEDAPSIDTGSNAWSCCPWPPAATGRPCSSFCWPRPSREAAAAVMMLLTSATCNRAWSDRTGGPVLRSKRPCRFVVDVLVSSLSSAIVSSPGNQSWMCQSSMSKSSSGSCSSPAGVCTAPLIKVIFDVWLSVRAWRPGGKPIQVPLPFGL